MSRASIPIVLTGTIAPTIGRALSPGQIANRRNEYLNAINFYSKCADHVYFLDNSAYPTSEDGQFQQVDNLTVCSMPLSDKPERGKGYQEFQMLDSWIVLQNDVPDKWLKITGRYIVTNVEQILSDCLRTQSDLLVDQGRFTGMCRTYIFYTTSRFYRKHILNAFLSCDDVAGRWIERVLYESLRPVPRVRYFAHRPHLNATIGLTERRYPNTPFVNLFKQLLRQLNSLFDRRYLWFAR